METALQEVRRIADDIKTITIQWATNVAREACKIMWQQLRCTNLSDHDELVHFFDEASAMLIWARETEPLLRNAMKYAKSKIHEWSDANAVADAFEEYLWWIEREEKIRPTIWANLIDDGDIVFTHCHSSSVVKVFVTAHNNGKKIKAYNTETRPLYQWRITSRDLVEAWIPDTMVTDDAAPYFIDNTTEEDVDVNKVFLWSDCIKLNGDTINKVWSFSISLSAWHSGIPLYIVWSLLKVDTENTIGIEIRNWKELWPDAPEGLEIVNYAFDKVPHKCITWIITEFGVIRPENLVKEIRKHYPWMLDS